MASAGAQLRRRNADVRLSVALSFNVPAMHARVLRRLLIVLLALTGIALLWNEFGMTTTMVMDARTKFQAEAVDDRANTGGRSVASLSRLGDTLGMDCDLRPGYEWAFCELQIE